MSKKICKFSKWVVDVQHNIDHVVEHDRTWVELGWN